jgi:hypothetical protein
MTLAPSLILLVDVTTTRYRLMAGSSGSGDRPQASSLAGEETAERQDAVFGRAYGLAIQIAELRRVGKEPA